MIEVTSDKFYEILGQKDLTVRPVGDKWPYRSEFRFRNGTLFGYEENERYYVKKEYVENGKVQ